MLPPCLDCGLRPRYFARGKWTTIEAVIQARYDTSDVSVHVQHTRWCPSWDNVLRMQARHRS